MILSFYNRQSKKSIIYVSSDQLKGKYFFKKLFFTIESNVNVNEKKLLLQVLKFVVLWNYFQMIWICWFFCQRIYKIIRGKSNNVFSLKIIRIYISIEKISVLSISYDSTREISQNVSFLKIIFCILEEVIIVFRMTLEFICES